MQVGETCGPPGTGRRSRLNAGRPSPQTGEWLRVAVRESPRPGMQSGLAAGIGHGFSGGERPGAECGRGSLRQAQTRSRQTAARR